MCYMLRGLLAKLEVSSNPRVLSCQEFGELPSTDSPLDVVPGPGMDRGKREMNRICSQGIHPCSVGWASGGGQTWN